MDPTAPSVDPTAPTGTPESTSSFEPTGTPEATNTPEDTGTPEAIGTPEATGTPDPVDTTDPTDTTVPPSTPAPSYPSIIYSAPVGIIVTQSEPVKLPQVGEEIKNSTGNYTVTEDAQDGKGSVSFSTVEDKTLTSTYMVPVRITVNNNNYTVKEIAANSYKNNKTIKKLTVGGSIETIGEQAFSQSKKLKTISLGNSVQVLKKEAFSNCKKLTSITISKGLTTIEEGCFSNCTSLKKIVIKSTTLKSIEGTNVFKNVENATIYVPKEKLKEYKELFKKCKLSSTNKIVALPDNQ